VRILIAHNRYQQRGGEDTVVANEIRMLEENGHQVDYLGVDNESVHGVKGKVLAAGRAFYSVASARSVEERIDKFRPDIVHIHNFLVTLSPSVFYAANNKRIPVVLTLHNYRLQCANAQLFRDGHPCEECIDRHSFLPGVQYACYRGSRIGSAIVGGSIALHTALGTWRKRVDRYITLTAFAAKKMASYRIPSDRIRIKPNFARDLGQGTGGGGFALFAGRLAPEKGIDTLIEADIKGLLPMPVQLVGDGPMREMIQKAATQKESRLYPLGTKTYSEVQELMRKATVLVFPSIWYEGFPMVFAEAFAAGLPILSSRIGGLSEIVEEGISGRLFRPGDPAALGKAMKLFVEGSEELKNMRRAARKRFESQYGAERNYAMLMDIYRELVPTK
jgi:glycosyltransferase involved in cell wall biosynthesis